MMGQMYSEAEYTEAKGVLDGSAFIGAEFFSVGGYTPSTTFQRKTAYKWMNGQKMCVDKWASGEPNSDGDPAWMRSDGSWDDFGSYTSSSFREVSV